MARATTLLVHVLSDGPVQEIVVPQTWRDRLEALAGRRRDLYLIAGIIGGALLLVMLSSAHRSRVAVAAPAQPESTIPVVSAVSPSPSTIFVHVAGAVRKPGLYQLPAGTRVAQAVEIAGGPAPKADLDLLNLAEIVIDAMKIDVPYRGEAAAPAPTTSSVGGSGIIDLNTADQASLESIPGVGPVTALAILQKRAELGRFDSLDQLLDVTGIGPATLEAIRPYVAL